MYPHENPGIEKKFILSLTFTVAILIVEVIGGLWTGSLALLSDSAHVLMDIFALGLSFAALRLSALPINDRHSYGYHRLEVLAALANGLTLAVIAFGILWEAVKRWQTPQPILGLEMLIIAVIGLVINLVVAFVLGGEHNHHENGHEDLNLKSAFLHVVGDAVSSVGVIVAGLIIWLGGPVWVDPLVSGLIGVLILFSAYRVLRSALHILLEGTPEGLSTSQVNSAMQKLEEVEEVHDLHVWSICSGHIALSAHVVLCCDGKVNSAMVMEKLKTLLLSSYGIEHTTIQFEDAHCGQI
jgi:cobalt-zinc-cadmium efflux system protein